MVRRKRVAERVRRVRERVVCGLGGWGGWWLGRERRERERARRRGRSRGRRRGRRDWILEGEVSLGFFWEFLVLGGWGGRTWTRRSFLGVRVGVWVWVFFLSV